MSKNIVEFNPFEFREIYPQWANRDEFTDAKLCFVFSVACTIWGNTERSSAPVDERKLHLYLLACHLLTMAQWGANGLSGPVSSQTAGTSSLSLSFQVPQKLGREWFLLTPCGASFWQATLKYRVGGKYYAPDIYHPWG